MEPHVENLGSLSWFVSETRLETRGVRWRLHTARGHLLTGVTRSPRHREMRHSGWGWEMGSSNPDEQAEESTDPHWQGS